ncbi:MAG: helix-turn-helix domain-containing protein [Gemmatimonadaceae bacterium]|nr:helix-turn-helix domain-containing protein [Gemmatimonadaceae bacterium]
MAGGTRGMILAQLRRGNRTVDELAAAVGTTDNSVRSHLATLERDGLVRVEGRRRSPGAGKPAVLYGVDPAADVALSKAYPAVLVALVEVLVDTLPANASQALLKAVGERLARAAGGEARGTREQRVEAAASALVSMGGDVEVVPSPGALTIQGYGCPLASAVSSRPEVCTAVEAFVADVTGEPTRQCCDHGERPRCRFVIGEKKA